MYLPHDESPVPVRDEIFHKTITLYYYDSDVMSSRPDMSVSTRYVVVLQ